MPRPTPRLQLSTAFYGCLESSHAAGFGDPYDEQRVHEQTSSLTLAVQAEKICAHCSCTGKKTESVRKVQRLLSTALKPIKLPITQSTR